jgi:hypothetical protein
MQTTVLYLLSDPDLSLLGQTILIHICRDALSTSRRTKSSRGCDQNVQRGIRQTALISGRVVVLALTPNSYYITKNTTTWLYGQLGQGDFVRHRATPFKYLD